jgi:hypothetical protein
MGEAPGYRSADGPRIKEVPPTDFPHLIQAEYVDDVERKIPSMGRELKRWLDCLAMLSKRSSWREVLEETGFTNVIKYPIKNSVILTGDAEKRFPIVETLTQSGLKEAIDHGSRHLLVELAFANPKVVITFGTTAFTAAYEIKETIWL